jgi:hypothetical protein
MPKKIKAIKPIEVGTFRLGVINVTVFAKPDEEGGNYKSDSR